MKSLALSEFAQIVVSSQALVGAQLQDCVQTPSEVGLCFYHDRETIWLWFDFHPQRPLLVRVHGKPPNRKKLTRPLLLFIRSHFFGRRLQAITADLARGRVMKLEFYRLPSEVPRGLAREMAREMARELASDLPTDVEDEKAGRYEIEIRLFPSGQNMIATAGSKSISERKPRELPPSSETALVVSSTDRTWDEIEREWWAEQEQAAGERGFRKVQAAARDAIVIDRDYQRAMEKKEKALLRMREDLELKRATASEFRQAGEWLKSEGMPQRRDERNEQDPSILKWFSHIDFDKSLSWNIENAFTRAKENFRKIEGTEARLKIVEAELAELRSKGPGSFIKKREEKTQDGARNLLARADARGRHLELAIDLDVYIGKSAADNLAILRRAQPFDYWLHMRDLPGSHAILRRTRARIVTESEFTQAARWVIEQTLAMRASELAGESHDVLIVECRFVRPIKGDRLGRVNYSSDRVLRVRF